VTEEEPSVAVAEAAMVARVGTVHMCRFRLLSSPTRPCSIALHFPLSQLQSLPRVPSIPQNPKPTSLLFFPPNSSHTLNQKNPRSIPNPNPPHAPFQFQKTPNPKSPFFFHSPKNLKIFRFRFLGFPRRIRLTDLIKSLRSTTTAREREREIRAAFRFRERNCENLERENSEEREYRREREK